jgi:hypothetical protein
VEVGTQQSWELPSRNGKERNTMTAFAMAVGEHVGDSTLVVRYAGRHPDSRKRGGWSVHYETIVTTPRWRWAAVELTGGLNESPNVREAFADVVGIWLNREEWLIETPNAWPQHVLDWIAAHEDELRTLAKQYEYEEH